MAKLTKKDLVRIAKARQAEIQRKTLAQKMQCSGGEGLVSSHAQLTETNRLIRCDHYKRSGANARLAFQREKLDNLTRRLREEKRAQGQIFRHVKRDKKGKTLSVVEKIY